MEVKDTSDSDAVEASSVLYPDLNSSFLRTFKNSGAVTPFGLGGRGNICMTEGEVVERDGEELSVRIVCGTMGNTQTNIKLPLTDALQVFVGSRHKAIECTALISIDPR